MNSESKIPCIPIEGSITYEDWLKGRKFRRELGNRVALRSSVETQAPATAG